MGLDMVELVMAVEERFGISIRAEDAEKVTTVRRLIGLVTERVGAGPSLTTCKTQVAFYRARRVLCDVLELPRARIRPEVRLDALVARGDMERAWPLITEHLGVGRLDAYQLCRPSWMVVGERCGATALLGIWPFLGTAGLLLVIVGLSLGYLFHLITRYRTELPPAARSMRAFAEALALDSGTQTGSMRAFAEALPLDSGTQTAWTPESVRLTIRHLVEETLGILPNSYSDDADFARDLGAD